MKQTIRTSDGKIYTGEVMGSLRMKGQRYWYVDERGTTDYTNEIFDSIDDYRYNTLNYFRTEKEAEAKRTYDLAVGEVTRCIQELGEGEYCVYYNNNGANIFEYEAMTYGLYPIILPLMSEETAQTIIKEYKDTLLPIIFKMK